MDETTTNRNDEATTGKMEQQMRRFEDLPPAAQRALLEAEERRAKIASEATSKPREVGGRGGQDPARYGDWEVKGVAVDF
jgi:hypothetical protein